MAAILIIIVVAALAWAMRRNGLQRLGDIMRARRLGIIVGLVGMGAAMLYSLYGPVLLWGHHFWIWPINTDGWVNWQSAEFLLFGHGSAYLHLFKNNPTIETVPGWTLLIAVPASATYSLHLSFPQQGYTIMHPSAWLLTGPIYLAAILALTCALDSALDTMGAWCRRNRVIALVAAAGLSCASIFYGHPEDIMALAFGIMAAKSAHEGRHVATGWWIGIALAMQLNALLVLPFLLAALPMKQWIRMLWRAAIVPVAVLAPPLIGDPSATLHTLLSQHYYKVAGRISPTWSMHTLGASSRAVVFAGAIALALIYKYRSDRSLASLMLLWGCVVSLRLIEPQDDPYYALPALILFIAVASRQRTRYMVPTVLVAMFAERLNWAPINGSVTQWLWVVAAFGVTAAMAAWPDKNDALPVSHHTAVRGLVDTA